MEIEFFSNLHLMKNENTSKIDLMFLTDLYLRCTSIFSCDNPFKSIFQLNILFILMRFF